MTVAHDADGAPAVPWLLVPIAIVAAGYVVMALRRRAEPRGWPAVRIACFLTGVTLLAGATLPVSPWPAEDFRAHMVQHLLLGMFAPTFLVLGAPMTLVLRTAPRPWGRQIGRLLHSRSARVLAHPVTALVLSVGGMVALYATPLYGAVASGSALSHHLVHAHFFASGYLFAWVVAGPDPAPRRPSVPARLVVLGVAIAAHAVVSQLLYAGAISVPITVDERRGAAELMYYGGDIAELLLALALLVTWRPVAAGRPPAAASPMR
jgi:putative membrane protein